MGEVGKVGTGTSNLKGMATKTVGWKQEHKQRKNLHIISVCVCVCVYVNTIYTCECAQCVQVHRHNN